jgi:predicted thioesterase
MTTTWPLIARTLWAAAAAETLPSPADGAAAALAGALRAGSPPHPAAPPVGATTITVFPVTDADTAAAMGHPDPDVKVVGSPRLALWFELATSPLMPAPGTGVRHVGVGLVVHHLDRAEIGETLTVEARVLETAGRGVVFTLEATTGERCVARGVHHRRILDSSL